MADKLEIDAPCGRSQRETAEPPRPRRAVEMLQPRLSMSQRRACQIVGARNRSTQATPRRRLTPEPTKVRPGCTASPRSTLAGCYRRAQAVLIREGHQVNRKKINTYGENRTYGCHTSDTSANGRATPRRPRSVSSPPAGSHVGAGLPVRPHRHPPHHQILHVIDEFTRESLSDLVGHCIDSEAAAHPPASRTSPACSRRPPIPPATPPREPT